MIFQDGCAELLLCFGVWFTKRRRNASQTRKYSTLAGDVTPMSVLAELFEKTLYVQWKQSTRHLKQTLSRGNETSIMNQMLFLKLKITIDLEEIIVYRHIASRAGFPGTDI